MATKVLYPQDCIPQRLRSQHAARRLQTNPNSRPNVSINPNPRACRMRRAGSPRTTEPTMVPKQIPVGVLRQLSNSGVYAGSVCSVSPAPSALPLPNFSRKKENCAAKVVGGPVDLSATNDLRRLLRLA